VQVTKLKADKLDLLKDNVAAQREVKRLRERELRLGADLGLAGRELGRLRGQLSRVQQQHTSTGDSDWEQE